MLLNLNSSSMVSTILFSGLGGAILSLTTSHVISYLKNKIQIMECHYIDDDILSKVPLKGVNEMIQENLYCKTFKLINTTNKDIESFKVLFQFDKTSTITNCYSIAKEGYNIHPIKKTKRNPNHAEAIIRNFNRKDWIEFYITIANINDNEYYITESESIGFKIICKDKRKDKVKTKSKQSNVVLTSRTEDEE